MTSTAKLLALVAVLCTVLAIGSTPAGAVATDTTTRSACGLLAKARTVSGVDSATLQDAADELALSRALGARQIADKLQASLARDSSAPRDGLRSDLSAGPCSTPCRTTSRTA